MGALLEQFAAVGVTLTTLPGGQLHAAGPLTDTLRAAIRAHKPAILAELAAANDAATPEQAAELRAHLARIAATWTDDDRAEALAVAPVPASPYTSAPLAERAGDDRRTCADCANLSGTGRCLSAARGNPPVGAVRSYHPIDDLLRRCEVYAPGPDDPDRRPGAVRWPDATEVKLDAERRLGEMLAATEKNTGAAGIGTAIPDEYRTTAPPTLAELGIDKKTSARAQKLATLPKETFAVIKAGETTLREVTHR